jgi:hypothetical protein
LRGAGILPAVCPAFPDKNRRRDAGATNSQKDHSQINAAGQQFLPSTAQLLALLALAQRGAQQSLSAGLL